MKNHYICNVVDSRDNREIQSRYFDGTQAQAIEYFKTLPIIRKYLNRQGYEVFVRGNSIDLNEVK